MGDVLGAPTCVPELLVAIHRQDDQQIAQDVHHDGEDEDGGQCRRQPRRSWPPILPAAWYLLRGIEQGAAIVPHGPLGASPRHSHSHRPVAQRPRVTSSAPALSATFYGWAQPSRAYFASLRLLRGGPGRSSPSRWPDTFSALGRCRLLTPAVHCWATWTPRSRSACTLRPRAARLCETGGTVKRRENKEASFRKDPQFPSWI